MAVGRVVLVAGVLILLFIPYLLWGTGLMTARSQSQLRTEFATAQRQAGVKLSGKPVAPTKGAPASTPHVAPAIPDPPLGGPVGVITIPAIDLSMVVVEGTSDDQLRAGPGHYPGTPLPGEAGNAAIAGHRTTYLHPFYNLNDLVAGDPITVETVQGIFLYHVTASAIVSPSDVSVIDATPTPTLTLTTCNPRFSATQRLVVHAALVASILAHPNVAPARTHATRSGNVSSSGANWWAAILWGLLVAAVVTVVWAGARQMRRGRRALVLVSGLIVWLVVVFFFFQSVTPLLPASY
jgi:sortase A